MQESIFLFRDKPMKYALCLCTLSSAAMLFAAEPASGWKAEWITVDKLPEYRLNNFWATYRKSFELRKVPEKAVCRIASDSKYWLYVNGERIVFDGQRKRDSTAYYDVVDLSNSLKPGKNVVAVLTWFFGKDGGAPALLFELQTDGLELLSDATWKAVPYSRFDATDPVWKEHPYSAYERITADPQPSARWTEPNIRYDARFEFKGNWTALGFDDADWSAAKVLGKPPIPPWGELRECPTPLAKEGRAKDYVNKSEIPAVSDGRPIICKMPKETSLTPLIKVDAPDGYAIDIRTDRYVVDGEYGVRSEYVTKSGIQEYESLGKLSGTTVIYTMPAGVKVLSLQYRESD